MEMSGDKSGDRCVGWNVQIVIEVVIYSGERDNVEDTGVNGECGGVAPNNPMEEAEVTNTGDNVSEADESMEESAA